MNTTAIGIKLVRQLERVTDHLAAQPTNPNPEPFKALWERLIGRVEGLEKRYRRRSRHFSLIVASVSRRLGDKPKPVGEKIISQATNIFRNRLRKTDIVGSFGPDNLVVGLIGADRLAAKRIASDLKSRILAELAGPKNEIVVNYGVAGWRPGMKIHQVIDEAQAALLHGGAANGTGVERLLSNNLLLSRIALLNYRVSYQRLIVRFERYSLIIVAACQRLGTEMTRAWLNLFTDLEVIDENILNTLVKPVIIVANHESHLDPMLVAVALRRRPDLFPIRYMAKNDLFLYPIFNLLIFLLGAFRAHRKKGLDRSLLTPLRTLKTRGSVMIFPEGQIFPGRPQLGQGRRGAAILALISRSSILPLSLHTPPGLTPWQIMTQRPRVSIRIGQPFHLDAIEYLNFSDEKMTKATNRIMDEIAKLYRQHSY